ncbi:DUF1684 domain-containing protein [Candidatus Uabimicrobium sp. HlEnr_7]|uniref:DUF1684 domain-containing protein n=1 Tax=Candidatus Uabimicrobium helgolandensis TaxID=3095367 RepID=UPI003555DBC4
MKKVYVFIICFCFSLVNADSYKGEIEIWKKQRISSLKKNWLSLVDLHWINKENTHIGSAENSDIRVSQKRFPQQVGIFTKSNNQVFFTPQVPGIICDGKPISTKTIVFKKEKSCNLQYESLSWFVIERSGKLAVRVRDYKNEDISKLDKVLCFSIKSHWKVKAKFVPYMPPKKIEITNILGMTSEDIVPGQLLFEIEGKEYSLDPVKSGSSLFIMFQDVTTGKTTYQVGRYIYADAPNEKGEVIIDFNKAYNPPCAYTPYATCPMAPEQNKLPVAITAGEKYLLKNH